MSEPTSPVRVAVVQFDPQVGIENCDANLCRSLELALEAVTGGANLIVLPELSSTGYYFSSRQDAFEHAQLVPGGPSAQLWIDFASRHNVYLVAGLAERDGMQLFNTAMLVGPDGFVGKYRKAHLWNLEKLWFTPGDLGFPVFDTPIGRIGMLICWDIWFPEAPRILSQQGADIICSVNNVFIAAASRIGEERGARYLGCSLIAGTNGWPIGAVASADQQEILFVDIDLTSSRSAPIWNNLNDLHRDRRADLYDQMLGYTQHPCLPR